MIDIFKSSEEKKSFVSTFSDPFKPDKVEEIDLTIRNNWWSNHKTEYKAVIRFKSGDTTGTHRIEAANFIELVQKTEAFIKNL